MHCGAEAINNRGDVVGACATPVGDGFRWHGVLWRDREVIDLGSLPGAGEMFRAPSTIEAWSSASSRPSTSTIAARSRARDAWRGAFLEALILDHGTIVRLPAPSLPYVQNCSGNAINRRGDVAGGCGNFPTVWVRGDPRVLPGLTDFVATVMDLNDRGAVVGAATAADGNNHAVLWPGAARQPPRHLDR